MKLEHAKHYLGTGATVVYTDPVTKKISKTMDLDFHSIIHLTQGFRRYKVQLALRDLSDINPEVDQLVVGTINYLVEASKLPYNGDNLLLTSLTFDGLNILIEKGFDVFNLISSGKAINVNVLEKEEV